jgi:hypothetical protein
MWRAIGQWPLLLGAVVCFIMGVWLISKVPNGNLGGATVMLTIGSVMLGAFLTLFVIRQSQADEKEK